MIFITADRSCLDRMWDPKTKIINTFFVIFCLCIAYLVFSRQKYAKSPLPLGAKKIWKRSTWIQQKYPEFHTDFRSEGKLLKNAQKYNLENCLSSQKNV
jgi:hypothetical protein